MSDNKFKYFAVTSTTIVKANNKTDAEKIAMSNRRNANVPGEVVFKDVEVERISASQAREQLIG
jgi:23S rRNA G2445 N2-methylase RlmL